MSVLISSSRPPNTGNPPGQFLYNAFISYSHLHDAGTARLLENGLKRFAKSPLRRRALRIFRDESNLDATPALWDKIRLALDNSEFFILLASPAAAKSLWVKRELEYWLQLRPSHNILLGLTDGAICWDLSHNRFDWHDTTALPQLLDHSFTSEPRWIDLRWLRDQPTDLLKDDRFFHAVADFAAPLHHVDKDTIIGEDLRQHKTASRLRHFAVTGLVGLFFLALVTALYALRQQHIAEMQRQTATSRLLVSSALSFADNALDQRNVEKAAAFLVEAWHSSKDPSLVEPALHISEKLPTRQIDYGSPVESFAFAPDLASPSFVVSTSNGMVHLHDLATTDVTASARYGGPPRLTLGSRGRLMLVQTEARPAGRDYTSERPWYLELARIPSLQPVYTLAGNDDPPLSGKISPDEQWLALRFPDRLVLVHTDTGEAHSVSLPRGFADEPMVFSSASRYLAIASGRAVLVYSLSTKSPLSSAQTFKHFGPIALLGFSPDEFSALYGRRPPAHRDCR